MFARYKTFYVHLIFSVAVFSFVFWLVFFLWYSSFLYKAVGVSNIMWVMLLVDVLVGPFLTFIVCRSRKKSIYDLPVIFVVQIAALSYGLFVVCEGRPAWLVFSTDRFDLVRVLDIDNRFIGLAKEEYRSPSLFGPSWVLALPPDDPKERDRLLFDSIRGEGDLPQRPDLYQPIGYKVDLLDARKQPLDKLLKYNSKEMVGEVLEHWPSARAWLPLMANAEPMVVLLDESTSVIGIVDLRPW